MYLDAESQRMPCDNSRVFRRKRQNACQQIHSRDIVGIAFLERPNSCGEVVSICDYNFALSSGSNDVSPPIPKGM
jgi:hypothetical protein